MAMEQLLELLQEQATLTPAQLASMLGEQEEDVVKAIKKYEKEGICAEKGVNVLEVTQSILQDMFVMVMMVDITYATAEVGDLADEFAKLGEENNLKIHVMHEDIFNSMHRI